MDVNNLPRLIDLSCVKANSTVEEMTQMVEMAKKYKFLCCFSMPYYTGWLIDRMKDVPDTFVGGTVGYPHGNELTMLKVEGARYQKTLGCREIDMVQNITALKHGDYAEVGADIAAVKAAIGDTPLKVILEVSYLTDYEICKACEIAVENGASFVKTGTGWGPSPTMVNHIKLMKAAVGDRAQIKAAGGIRTVDTMMEMIDAGCTRFGIGLNSSVSILRQAGLWEE